MIIFHFSSSLKHSVSEGTTTVISPKGGATELTHHLRTRRFLSSFGKYNKLPSCRKCCIKCNFNNFSTVKAQESENKPDDNRAHGDTQRFMQDTERQIYIYTHTRFILSLTHTHTHPRTQSVADASTSDCFSLF